MCSSEFEPISRTNQVFEPIITGLIAVRFKAISKLKDGSNLVRCFTKEDLNEFRKKLLNDIKGFLGQEHNHKYHPTLIIQLILLLHLFTNYYKI